MKKLIATIIIIFTSSYAFASISSQVADLTNKYKIKNADIGISVQRTHNGKQLFQYKATNEFTPASNNKLFTAIAALITLPSNFKFNTTIYANPLKVSNNTLFGNVYIKFTGDPSLTSRQLLLLLKNLKAKGINKIQGNIILIANQFTGSLYPDGWSKSDMKNCYAAPTSSMNLNKNCMIISVSKTNKDSSKVRRIVNTQSINIINRVKVIPLSNKSTCTISPHMTSRNELYLDGCLKEYKEVRISLPINNPSLKTLNTVKRYLKKLDITYTGTVIIGKLPNGVKAITYISSETLFPLLKHMLLHSDNLYAESIARSVGYKLNGSGNITSSTQAIKNIISKKLDINTKFLILKDGSGLSSLDKTSPQLLVNLLTKTFNMPRIGNELYNSLPQSGISGTLSYRMNKQLQGKVRAKTGTLKGTVTLSGYVITKRKNQLTFSIMINKLKKSQRNSARAFQNNVVKLFYDNY